MSSNGNLSCCRARRARARPLRSAICADRYGIVQICKNLRVSNQFSFGAVAGQVHGRRQAELVQAVLCRLVQHWRRDGASRSHRLPVRPPFFRLWRSSHILMRRCISAGNARRVASRPMTASLRALRALRVRPACPPCRCSPAHRLSFCLAGSASNETGATVCAPADPGFVQPNKGSIASGACSFPVALIPRPGLTSRILVVPCPMGTFIASPGQKQCFQCSPGSYTDKEGSFSLVVR